MEEDVLVTEQPPVVTDQPVEPVQPAAPVVNVDPPDVHVEVVLPSAAPTAEPTATPVPTATPEPVQVTTSLSDPSDPEKGSLKSIILQVFGDYEPRTQTIETSQGDQQTIQTEIVPGVAGVDWPWLAGVLVFSIAFYGFFRILGVLIRG